MYVASYRVNLLVSSKCSGLSLLLTYRLLLTHITYHQNTLCRDGGWKDINVSYQVS